MHYRPSFSAEEGGIKGGRGGDDPEQKSSGISDSSPSRALKAARYIASYGEHGIS